MSPWPNISIAELGTVVTGSTPPTSDPGLYGEDIPFVTPAELDQCVPISSARRWLSHAGANAARILPPGSVMVSCIGSLGKTAIAGRPVATNQQINSIVFNPTRVFPRFGFYACRRLKPILELMAPATTLPIIAKSKFEQLQLPVPPLEEQRRIAAILDKADAIRRKRQEAIALTEQLLRSTFLEMFGDPVTNPKRWPSEPLQRLAAIGSGVMKGRDYTGIDTVERPYMRVANVQDGYLALADIKTIEVPAAEVEKYALRHGDVLLTEGGDPDKLGRGAVWRDQIAGCVHQNHIFRVRPEPDLLTSEYLCSLLGSAYGKRYFLRAAKQTTGIATINRTQLSEFPVLLPPLDQQRRYSAFVAAHERTCQHYQLSLSQQDHLFNSLVQRAFSGQL